MANEDTQTTLLAAINPKEVWPKNFKRDCKKQDFPAMFKIAGRAQSVTTKPGLYGESKCFIGHFEVITQDGRKFMSSKAFLPGFCEDLVTNALSQADGQPVVFGFEIGTTLAEKSPVGYIWTATPLGEVKRDDELQLLLK